MLSKGRHADGRKQELWERREVGWLWFSFAEKWSSSLLTPITTRSGNDEDGQFPITVMLGELIWCVVAGCLKPSGAEQPWCSKTILPAKGLGLGPAAPPEPRRRCAPVVRREVDHKQEVTWAGRRPKPGVTFFPSIRNILGDYWELERVWQVFKPSLRFFLWLFWHSCFALLFVKGSWLLNLPRHLLIPAVAGSSKTPGGWSLHCYLSLSWDSRRSLPFLPISFHFTF